MKNINLPNFGASICRVLLFACLSCYCSAENNSRLLTVKSPSGDFTCESIPGKGGLGAKVQVYDSKKSKTVEIHESPRWVEITWSDDGCWLAIVDHADGHFTTIQFFSVVKGTPDFPNWKLVKVYSSPWPTRYDCKWSLVKWHPKTGSVTIQCRYRSQLPEKSGQWITRNYEIPLDYP